jgi:hypothetical protein
MKVRKPLLVAVAAAAALCLPLRAAHAGAGYTSEIIEDDVNPTDIDLQGCTRTGLISNQTVNVTKCKTNSSIALTPTTSKGAGGIFLTLKMTKVSCGSSIGTCNANNHVVELQLRAIGNDVPCVDQTECATGLPYDAAAGVLFNIANGSAGFPGAGGKNKIGVGALFGFISSQIFTRSIGVGQLRLHNTASNPADCGTAPLLHPNGCIDGDIYAVAGFEVPVDKQFACATDANCPAEDSCILPPGSCQPTQCNSNAECQNNPKTGDTVVCDVNGTGNCCICSGSHDAPTCGDTAVCP